jgi:hypothetical protein
MKNKVESYLVRIYRRGSLTTGIAGTVEIIGREKTEAFRSDAELLEIMKIRPLSDRLPDKFKQPGKAMKPRRINPEQNNRRKK